MSLKKHCSNRYRAWMCLRIKKKVEEDEVQKSFTLELVAIYIATSLGNLHGIRGKKISLLTLYDPRSWLEDKIFEIGRSLLRAKVEVMDIVHMIRVVVTIFQWML